MNKKITSIILTITIVFSLTGCQLAQEDKGGEKSQDRLIGVYLSYEHIDLFDFNGYLNDNLKGSSGEIIVDDNSNEYQGRMYATQKEKEFVFEEVEGISMFASTVKNPYDDETYISFNGGEEGISDPTNNVISGDNEYGIELKGTIYISFDVMKAGIYSNPVYQSADGRVYLTGGQGVSVEDEQDIGGTFTVNFNEEVKVNENGKSKTYKTSVEASAEIMNPTEKITIIQMNKDNNILMKNDYEPENVPKELLPESETDYIIVESLKVDKSKQSKIERTLFSKSDENLWYFTTKNGKVFLKTYTEILWPNYI